MIDYAALLMETGLVQFGRFGADGAPLRINAGMLASYPDVLDALAGDLSHSIAERAPERLLCAADSVPLGVALSLRTGIPLVYSLGTNQGGVHDLIGAYDVGHPTCLVLNTWCGESALTPFLRKAAAVGLDVGGIGVAFDLGHPVPNERVFHAVIDLPELLNQWEQSGIIPAGMRDAVMGYLVTAQTL